MPRATWATPSGVRVQRVDEAIVALERAIALEPDHAEAHNNLGLALHDNGRLDDAIDAYRRAIALRPDLAEAHNNLGTALKFKGRTDEAIGGFRRAIAHAARLRGRP